MKFEIEFQSKSGIKVKSKSNKMSEKMEVQHSKSENLEV